ncbi:MAG: hypothetical protein JW714_01925 [Candidatus Omnitrophica bacterium]|nr:hypothetical protein [Candidatus Omnitrophota bacterium]
MMKVVTIVALVIGLLGLIIQVRKGATKGGQVKAQKDRDAKHEEMMRELEKFYEFAKKIDDVTPEDKQNLAKYGGAVVMKLALEGLAENICYLFDYGNAQTLDRNRVSLYFSNYNLMTIKIFDNDSVAYELSARVDIKPFEEKEIICSWNKEYGTMALFIDGKLYGEMKAKHLNIRPVEGEISLASDLKGQQHSCLTLFEVKIYSFH